MSDCPQDRDAVLFAFHEACPRPTAEQIIDWTSRYPHFAEDIRDHAAVARDWVARAARRSQGTYDRECDRLARHFLSDELTQPNEDEVRDLAQTIQQAVEDWWADRHPEP